MCDSAGFFTNLRSIPPVLRWIQWLAPLKYALEALTVNEISNGLLIKVRDSLTFVLALTSRLRLR